MQTLEETSTQNSEQGTIYDVEKLIVEKQTLLQEIERMEEQKKIYDENKDFFDKLILFYQSIEDMKQTKNELIQKINRMSDINNHLKLKIAQVEENLASKDQQEEKLQYLLQQVKEIKEEVKSQ